MYCNMHYDLMCNECARTLHAGHYDQCEPLDQSTITKQMQGYKENLIKQRAKIDAVTIKLERTLSREASYTATELKAIRLEVHETLHIDSARKNFVGEFDNNGKPLY